MNSKSIHPLVAEAKEFVDKSIRPYAGQFDVQGEVPKDVIQAMADKGFLGSILPVEYDGSGLDALTYGYLTEELGKGCNSVRTLLTVHTSLVGETLARLGTAFHKENYLTAIARGEKIACFALSEPGVGTDATAVQTSYVEDSDSFVINGRKKWISYAAIADVFLVFASDSTGAVSAFLVDRVEGVSTIPMTGMLASRGSHIAEVFFDDVRVPKRNLVGRLGMGFSFVANTALFYGRYSIAWAGVALAHAAVEEMATYARTREQFGKKIGQYQLVQGLIADAVTSLHLARSMCEKVGRLRIADDDQAIMETNIAKYFTSKAAMDITTNAVQVFGGNGCWNIYPVERLFREAKVLEIIEGTSQIQQVMIAEFGINRYYRALSKVEHV
jgi:alkylation response protein AidB-like acyl-CoA dehydrogenase